MGKEKDKRNAQVCLIKLLTFFISAWSAFTNRLPFHLLVWWLYDHLAISLTGVHALAIFIHLGRPHGGLVDNSRPTKSPHFVRI